MFVAVILTVFVFPDVIFMKASLLLTDQVHGAGNFAPFALTQGAVDQVKQPVSFYPVPEHLFWFSGHSDPGGAVLQSEPMAKFVSNSLKKGQSPYWNPYSGSGALGPEVLADVKFSPLSLLSEALGGTSLIYNIVSLAFFTCGLFFLCLMMRTVLLLSLTASTGAGLLYLLNGYCMANIGSNVTQSHFFLPMVLYAATVFVRGPNSVRFAALVCAFAILLSCSFMPTTITALIGVYIVILGLLTNEIRRGRLTLKQAFSLVLLQAFAGIIALCLISALYFPIFENILLEGLIEEYSGREFFPLLFPAAIVPMFSPSLFFESYLAISQYPDAFTTIGNTSYHFGIVAIALTGCAVSRSRATSLRPAVMVFYGGGLLILCRLFGLPGISTAIDNIPVMKSIGCQYWWPALLAPLILLAGIGLENIRTARALICPALGFIAVGLVGALFLAHHYGLPGPNLDFRIMAIACSILLLAAVLSVIIIIRFKGKELSGRAGALVLIALMFIELIAAGKCLRYQRSDFFETRTPAVDFLIQRAGLFRTVAVGWQWQYYPELGSAFSLHDAASISANVFPYYKDFFHSTFNLHSSQLFGGTKSFPTTLGAADNPGLNAINWEQVNLMGIRYIVIPDSFKNYRESFLSHGLTQAFSAHTVTIFENPGALPRAFGVSLDDAAAAEVGINLAAGYQDRLKEVTIRQYENARVSISGVAEGAMLVVLTDVWHRNWRATLNGGETAVAKVEGIFRGVEVSSPGYFEIEMTYRPRSLKYAAMASLGAVALLFCIFLCHRRFDGAISKKWRLWASGRDFA